MYSRELSYRLCEEAFLFHQGDDVLLTEAVCGHFQDFIRMIGVYVPFGYARFLIYNWFYFGDTTPTIEVSFKGVFLIFMFHDDLFLYVNIIVFFNGLW